MLIFVAYLGHQARLCVSLIENVNCSNEKKKRANCHWKHAHFSTDALFIRPRIKYSLLYTSKAIVPI